MEERIVETVCARLPDIEGHENMKIKVCRGYFTLYYKAAVFYFEFTKTVHTIAVPSR